MWRATLAVAGHFTVAALPSEATLAGGKTATSAVGRCNTNKTMVICGVNPVNQGEKGKWNRRNKICEPEW
jgi:hypothetical protein